MQSRNSPACFEPHSIVVEGDWKKKNVWNLRSENKNSELAHVKVRLKRRYTANSYVKVKVDLTGMGKVAVHTYIEYAWGAGRGG